MIRNKLVRSDGSIIDSSVIISCEYTEEVNSSTNLSVGDTTASELAVEMLSTHVIEPDEVLTYYMIEDGVEKKIGVFTAEKPTVATRTSMRFSAYDNMTKTEKLFSDWLRENQGLFPMTLLALVQYACEHCGVTLATTDFPESDLSVNAFYADGITCRQVISWASAIAGRFVKANENGEIEFAWYRDSEICISPSPNMGKDIQISDDGNGNISIISDSIELADDGEGNVTINTRNIDVTYTDTGISINADQSIPYFQGGLTYENYTTDPIERVQINHSEDDVGVIYPTDIEGNCFTISENMILGGLESAKVEKVASDLYTHLSGISYVPFSATVLRTIRVRAGDIIEVVDSNGVSFRSYVMKITVSSGGTELTSTGDKSFGSNAAVSSEKYSNITGKILAIKKSVDGLVIEASDLGGKVASLSATVDGFDTYVGTKIKDALDEYDATVGTKLTQTANGWDYQFGALQGDLSGLSEELQKQLEERKANIRFEDGNILLGRAASEIMLILRNDRISFVRNVVGYPELAYISDDTLYITEGEFLNQMRIGKFGFTPGANGNLSFKKVVS